MDSKKDDAARLKDSITDRQRFPSFFFTNQRNLMRYWIMLLSVTPAYVAGVYILGHWLINDSIVIFETFVISELALWGGIWTTALLPLALTALAPPHTKQGRSTTTALGIFTQFAFVLLEGYPEITTLMLTVLLIVYVVGVILYAYGNALNWRHIVLSIPPLVVGITLAFIESDLLLTFGILLTAFAMLTAFVELQHLEVTNNGKYFQHLSYSLLLSLFTTSLLASTVVVISVFQQFLSNAADIYLLAVLFTTLALFYWGWTVAISDTGNVSASDNAINIERDWVLFTLQVIAWASYFVIVAVTHRISAPLFAMLALLIIYISLGPGHIISEQRSHFRRWWFSFAQVPIREQIISGKYQGSIIERAFRYIRSALFSERPWLGMITSAAAGGILLPIVVANNADADILELFLFGTTSAGIFTTVYLAILFINRRDRYIIEPFDVIGEDHSHLLSGMATLLAHSLAEQVQELGTLLSLRQIEDGTAETAASLFVTSGIDESKILTQLQSLVSLPQNSDENKSRSAATIWLVRAMAVIRVRGTVQRLEDDSVRVWIELTRRGSRTVAVDIRDIPPNVAVEMDDNTATRYMRETSIKLILKLGEGTRLTTSPESFSAFVTGLQATTRRNWWHAVEAFQQAVQLDPKGQTGFTIGYYHLGAAYFFRGEFEEARKYLLHADAVGPTLAETQYMLALLDLIENWDNIHADQVRFANVVRRCKAAIELRPDFPEAFHVLGAAYYQCGKLSERHITRKHDKHSKDVTRGNSEIKKLYQLSVRYLRRAIRHYQRAWKRLPASSNMLLDVEREANRISRELVIVMHRLADSLRSLGYFTEAESYYREVLSAYPTNIRTLTDVAKTFCMAGNWQQADQFLSREVLHIPLAKWNADVNIYIAWALFGGIASLKKWTPLDLLLIRPENEGSTNITSGQRVFIRPLQSKEVIFDLMGSAITHLDLALTLRPRYMTRWRQTDWMVSLLEAFASYYPKNAKTKSVLFSELREKELKEHYNKLLKQPSSEAHPIANEETATYLNHLILWIAWRMHSRGYHNDQDPILRQIRKSLPPSIKELYGKPTSGVYPHDDFQYIYAELLRVRCGELMEHLRRIDDQGRVEGINNAYERLRIGEKLFQIWRTAHEKVHNLISLSTRHPNLNEAGVTFADRWAIDVYAELSILAGRILLEAGVYETVYLLTTKSKSKLNTWITKVWFEAYKGSEESNDSKAATGTGFTFSHRIMRYQISSLISLRVYAAARMSGMLLTASRMQHDFESLVRRKTIERLRNSDHPTRRKESHIIFDEGGEPKEIITKSEMLDEVNTALAYIQMHPLAVYARANVYRIQEQYATAIDETNRLLTAIEPLDPNRLVGSIDQRAKRTPRIAPRQSRIQTTQTLRKAMYYQERISGRAQFKNLVNPAFLYAFLADVYLIQRHRKQSADQRMMAIITSPYWDFDADQLFILVETFNQLEQYANARAVIRSLRARRHLLEDNTLSVHKVFQPDIFEAINATRRNEFEQSLEQTLKLLGQPPRYEALENQYHQYKVRLISPHSNQAQEHVYPLRHTLESTLNYVKHGLMSAIEELYEDTAINDRVNVVAETLNKGMHFTYLYADVDDNQRQRMLAEMLWMAYLRLNPNTMAEVINRIGMTPKHAAPYDDLQLDINWQMQVKLLAFLSLEAVRFLEQRALLHNSATYNRVELYLDPELKLINSSFQGADENGETSTTNERITWEEANFLTSLINENTSEPPYDDLTYLHTDRLLEWRPSRYNMIIALNIIRFLYQATREADDHSAYTRYARYLALIYDTHAWYLYRRALEDLRTPRNRKELYGVLLQAANLLEDYALYYDQSAAIIHYHLARVHVTLIERLWQNKDINDADNLSNQINYHLSRALRHWLRARENDYDNRLAPRLTSIGKRIEKYRKGWDDKYMNEFSGNNIGNDNSNAEET